MALHVEQLSQELQKRIKKEHQIKEPAIVPSRFGKMREVVLLGKMLALLDGASRRDALWVLRELGKHLDR